ncbi:MAG: IS200 family transposase [Veillonella sp. DORA_A_3_16_22]|nr:MAG: IS200 family transposase [Veillonella sp. DORA_A_3_16_22]
MATKTQSLAHTKWLCKYHIVFTPKYRRKVIYNQYRNSLREILRRLCEYKGVKIIEGELMADHVHMLVLIIVFTPKYRRKVIYNQYRNSLREILRRLCEYKGVKIIEGELMADHVHMLVLIPPKISVSSFMGYLKGKSALMMFDKHANLKYKFGNRHFWSEGYYVSTVGLNEATVKKYIREQELHDQMKDKLSVKEYEDPFKGSK